MTAPLIGIVAHPGTVDVEDVGPVVHQVANPAYIRAVRKAGGLPLLLPLAGEEEAADFLSGVDGLILTGGVDVDPSRYGEEPDPRTGPVDPRRDEVELALARLAVERDMPTLAICRGCQVLNVALGGTLVQHIDGHFRLDRHSDTVHKVMVEPGSVLARWLGREDLEVNTLHHQAVASTGPNGRVSASADDGTIEAVESGRRVVGVQWHPELLRHRPEHLALFGSLVAEAVRTA